MKCNYCDKTFPDDDADAAVRYAEHQNIHRSDSETAEEKAFEDFRAKMIRQKKAYEKSREEQGDSDLVFNSMDGDAHRRE